MTDRLIEKVHALPEIYQPIFGHPEIAQAVSRNCEDRLHHLNTLHDALREELGRPVRVLDLGCAQGYICFSLAARGAQVVGIDFLAANVDVCVELASEQPGLEVRFEHTALEPFIEKLNEDAFDLVLGLSVFHHVVHERGLSNAKRLMDCLAARVAVGAFELALVEEPLYWAASLPEDAREILLAFDFTHELARFPTHLSDISRPLYVASSRYWYLGGDLQHFERVKVDSHALANGIYQSTRRYLFGGGKLAKLVRFDVADARLGDANKLDWQREVATLSNVPSELINGWPKLIAAGEGPNEGWLIRSVIDGELLLDVIARDGNYEPSRVIGDVLKQLAILERQGRYHNDVRVWNVLLTVDGSATLIDYGAISSESADCTWPDDLFLAFFIFVHEVATRSAVMVAPFVVPTFISPFNLPEPYASWMASFWSRPRLEWTFQALQDDYLKSRNAVSLESKAESSSDLWMAAIERHLTAMGRQLSLQDTRLQLDGGHINERLGQVIGAHQALDASVVSLNKSCGDALDALNGQSQQLQGYVHLLQEQINGTNQRVEQMFHNLESLTANHEKVNGQWLASERERLRLQQELLLVLNSHSFRITKPLRHMANSLRTLRSMMAKLARPVWHRMVRHAWGRRIGLIVFYPFPGLRKRLNVSIVAHVRKGVVDLPPPAQNKILSVGSASVYERLQQGMKSRNPRKGA
jgi:O-antigen chain-terminating methyltransferase